MSAEDACVCRTQMVDGQTRQHKHSACVQEWRNSQGIVGDVLSELQMALLLAWAHHREDAALLPLECQHLSPPMVGKETRIPRAVSTMTADAPSSTPDTCTPNGPGPQNDLPVEISLQ